MPAYRVPPIPASAITPRDTFLNRRQLVAGAALAGAATALPAAARAEAARAPAAASSAGGTGLRAPVSSEVDAIDLLDHAGAPVLQRLVPVLGGGVLLVLVILLIRRLRAG